MANDKDRRPSRPTGRRFAARGRASTPDVGTEDRISTIRAGQGARVTNRKNAAAAAGRARKNAEERYYKRHPEARAAAGGPERSSKNVVLLVAASVAILVVVFLLGSCIVSNIAANDAAKEAEEARNEQKLDVGGERVQDPDTEQAGLDGTVSYQGSSLGLQQGDDGQWSVVLTDASGSAETLFLLEGTPAAIARSFNTIVIPENRSGSWDVVCYVLDGHSNASYVVGEDGAKVTGSGDVSSVEIDGTTLRVTDSTGATTDVSLV